MTTNNFKAPKVFLCVTVLCGAPTLAFAQGTPAPATPATPAPEATPAEAAPPLAPMGEAPANEAPPTEAAASAGPNLNDVAAKVEGLEESTSATKVTVDKLDKIKVSGYVQGRFEWHDLAASGLNAAGQPAETDRFFVRRGRVKVAYAGTNAEFLLQIDATGAGVALRDAEATFVDTWTPFGLRLTVGQFKVPFGYEVLQSSGDREMPERSRFIREFFPGERDRGIRLQASQDWFRFSAAVINGNLINDSIYPNTDTNGWKDIIGRIGGDFDWIVVGLSGQYGRALKTTLGKPFSVAGTDTDGDGKISGAELTFTPATPATYTAFKRLRLGADVQSYFDIPGVGGLALKGEVAWSQDKNMDATQFADPCRDITSLGWALTGVQNIGEHTGVVFRVDQFIPNMASRASTCAASLLVPATSDKITTFGGGPLIYGSGNIKATLVYEKVTGQKNVFGSDDDRFTAQLQAKF